MSALVGCRRIQFLVLSLVWLLAASPVFLAHGAEPAKPADVPDWALGALEFRELGKGLDKAGAYASRVVPNSAELAKQIAANQLFDLPLDAGLKLDAPAAIYWFGPALRGDRASVLPVSDAAAVKRALAAAYGPPAETNGVLTFTLPQPLPEPDKTLLVKIAGERVLTAPNLLVLRKLEDFLEQRKPLPLPPARGEGAQQPADALLTLKVPTLKRMYGDMLAASLDLGISLATQNKDEADRLRTQANNILGTLWQIEAVALQLDFDATGAGAAAELHVVPVSGTALAEFLSLAARATDGKLLALGQADAPLAAAWNMNGTLLPQWLSHALDQQSKPGRARDAMCAALEVSRNSTDEAALVLDTADGLTAMLSLRMKEPKKAAEAVKNTFDQMRALLDDMAVPVAADGLPQITLKPLAESEHSGVKIQGYQLDGAGAAAEKPLGGPLSIQYALAGDVFCLAAGKKSADNIRYAIESHKQERPLPEARKAALAALPRGTFAAALLAPLPLLKLAVPDMAERISAGLASDASVLSLRQTENLVALRLELPATATKAIYTFLRRYQSAAAGARRAEAKPVESVPAPPPQ